MRIFAPAFETECSGVIAQLVEQRTENPCVPGSIPGGTTEKKRRMSASFFLWCQFVAALFISLTRKRSPCSLAATGLSTCYISTHYFIYHNKPLLSERLFSEPFSILGQINPSY